MKPTVIAATFVVTACLAVTAWLSAPSAPTAEPVERGAARASGALHPFDVLPVDSMLVWKGRPDPDLMPPPVDGTSLLMQLVRQFAQGSIPPSALFAIRLFEGFGEVIRHPFAVALISADARPTAEGRGDVRGTDYEILIAIDCGGQDEKFLKLIANAIRELTDSGQATMNTRDLHGYTFQELADKRLDWCRIAWGRIDNLFVVSFGTNVWTIAAETAAGKRTSVAADEWVRASRARRGDDPLVEILVGAGRIRSLLDEPLEGRASDFFEAWSGRYIDRAWWSIGFKGLALYTEADFDVSRTNDRTVHRVYARADVDDPRYMSLIPRETRYAVFDVPAGMFLPRLIGGFYATRPDAHQRAITREWERFQRERRIDVENELLANLGDKIIVHDFPRHPLKIPLAVTMLVPIEHDKLETRRRLNLFCESWQTALQQAAVERPVANAAQLIRDGDSWYVAFGDYLKAFAWTFTDDYIVLSWSPWALEEYLLEKGDQVGLK